MPVSKDRPPGVSGHIVELETYLAADPPAPAAPAPRDMARQATEELWRQWTTGKRPAKGESYRAADHVPISIQPTSPPRRPARRSSASGMSSARPTRMGSSTT